ncbi:MAG TPA: hypothetical protein VMN57_09510, partial [Anaerolineales bacterium]|nr:hypothetical protein [Anaerolineales bacterium]
ACFEKALRVLLETVLGDEEEIELPEFAPPIDEILEAVPVQSLNDDLLTMLAFHFDRTGHIRRAEEAIRILFERNGADPDIRDTVRSFYEYLLDLDETDLRASGVPVEAARELWGRLERKE